MQETVLTIKLIFKVTFIRDIGGFLNWKQYLYRMNNDNRWTNFLLSLTFLIYLKANQVNFTSKLFNWTSE